MAYRWLGVLALTAACSFGCENSGSGGPFSGDAGVGGSGGDGGAGGVGGTGGVAGAGGSQVSCTTSVLCRSCPSEGFCETSDDCSVGSVCIESGCSSAEGSAIKQCVFAGGGACGPTADCPTGRECMEVPVEGDRCVKITSGCDTRFDCVLGFSCEAESCVDRRVPCDLDPDCPKNHTCLGTMNSSFCVRIQQGCLEEFDCIGLAPRCEDIDGDGNKDCAGVFDPNQPSPSACVNLDCSSAAAPVCEAAGPGSWTVCGDYGLCLTNSDCDVTEGFECVGLWPDERKECVPSGGSCSSFIDCPVQQTCAAPREGGAPSCQVGYQP